MYSISYRIMTLTLTMTIEFTLALLLYARERPFKANIIHTARHDKTVLSVTLCRVGFGSVNWIHDNSRLSPTENLERVNSNCSIHTALPDTTHTRLFCSVWCGDVNSESARQPDRCVLCRSVSGGAVRPPDALRHRTHLSGDQFTPSHQTRQDKTVAPACRPPPPRSRHAGSYA